MRLFLILIALLLGAGGWDKADAQTIIKVPFTNTFFAWQVGVTDATHSAPTKHVITCGSIVKEVPMPATSISVASVVPGPGVYTCNLYAANDFGRQTEANVPFPQFEAGFIPNAPKLPILETR